MDLIVLKLPISMAISFCKSKQCHVARYLLYVYLHVFQAVSVEYIWMEGSDDKNSLRKFMEERGYTVRAEVTDGNWASNDYIFVKKGFNEDVRLPDIRTKEGEIPDVD